MGQQTFLERPTTDPPEVDSGLRSVSGIKWLLVTGALLTAVSLYRLVQQRWAQLWPEAQLLVLCSSVLALFGAGRIARHRLQLRQAGAALLWLFVSLVPVLCWGASRLGLLARPSGWLALAVGLAPLFVAMRVVLLETFRYRGAIYPAALALLAVATPVLPLLHASPLWTALALGAVLHAGCRHVNRFLFHRDRVDGVDRPLSVAPFLFLLVFYAVAMITLAPLSPASAVPLAVVALSLVDTGEEYYQALAGSLGHLPSRWPKRSVALLAVGFSLLAAALPLSLFDPTGQAFAVVAILSAARLLVWAYRTSSPLAHVLGVAAAFLGYNASPVLFRPVALRIAQLTAAAIGVPQGSPSLAGLADLGFFLVLLGLGLLLRRGGRPEGLRRTHAVLTVLHALVVAAIAFTELRAAVLVLPLLLVSAALGLVLTRRVELTVAVLVGLFGTAVSWVSLLAHGGRVMTTVGLGAGSLVVLAVTAGSRWAEKRLLARLSLTESAGLTDRLVSVASLVLGVLSGTVGLLAARDLTGVSALVLLAGLVVLASGVRMEARVLALLGAVPVSLGVHGLASELLLEPVGPLVMLALLAASWTLHRRSAGQLRVSGASGLAFNAPLALLSLAVHAVDHGQALGFRPLSLVAVGALLVEIGTKRRTSVVTRAGLVLLSLFPPVQLWALGWVTDVPQVLLLSGVALLAGHALLVRDGVRHREVRASLAGEIRALLAPWSVLSLTVCLVVSGLSTVALAALLVGVTRLTSGGRRKPLLAGVLVVLQLAVWGFGAPSGWLPVDLVGGGLEMLAALVAGALAWCLVYDLFPEEKGDADPTTPIAWIAAWSVVAVALAHGPLATGWHVLLVASTLLFAVRHARLAIAFRSRADAWGAQAFLALAALDAFVAGFLHVGHGRSPYLVLAAASLLHAASRLVARTELDGVFVPSLSFSARVLPLVAGALSLYRTLGSSGDETVVWMLVLPTFLVSAFYAVVSWRDAAAARIPVAILSATFLMLGLGAAVRVSASIGPELYFLAPGLSLLLLSQLLWNELGPAWRRHVFTAGAALLYATPVFALRTDLSWDWLALLLVLSVAFGAASFVLRSQSLLTVSTVAMLIDLSCFVLAVGRTEPMALWVMGAAFGLFLMVAAGILEYRREGVLQRIRVFAEEIQAWG